MKLGISTACYYPDETESAVSRLAAAGIGTVEIFLNTFSELDPAYIVQLKQILGETEVVSVHPFTSGLEPFLFFTGYDRRYQDGIELYKRYYQACAALGARYLVFHGDRRESGFAQELYFERFAQLDSIARTFGVQLLQENVARCRSNSPAFLRAMREYLHQEVGFVLDTKQCLRSGTTAFEVLESMGACVRHVHISDSTPQFDCLPPGKGDFAFDRFVQTLEEIGFEGAVLIELYRQNYGEEQELLSSYQNLCNLFKENQQKRSS